MSFGDPSIYRCSRAVANTLLSKGSLPCKLGVDVNYRVHGQLQRLHADLKVVALLWKQGTRLVAIDNVYAIQIASSKARREKHHAFRFLRSEGRMPMVVAGLEVAVDIFAEDIELAWRPIVLRRQCWAPGEASQRLTLVLARGIWASWNRSVWLNRIWPR